MIDVVSTQGETIQIREDKARQFPAAITPAVAKMAQRAVARRDRHGDGWQDLNELPAAWVADSPSASARGHIASRRALSEATIACDPSDPSDPDPIGTKTVPTRNARRKRIAT